MRRLALCLVVWLSAVAWAVPTPTPAASPSPTASVSASPQTSPMPMVPIRSKLRVAVAGSPPFVLKGPLGLDGVSVRLWEMIASQLGLAYEFSYHESVENALNELTDGTADVVVGPIIMTHDRVARMDLTVPYFISHLGILTHARTRSLFDHLKPFLTEAFFMGTGIMLMALTVVGWLVWLAERRSNPTQFKSTWRTGLGDGMWFAMSTMTGVGYGDLYPKTPPGRVVAALWMLLGSVFFSTLTAAIATGLTLAHLPPTPITSSRQLSGQRVAVLDDVHDDVLERSGASLYRVPNLEAGMQLFDEGRVEAVIYSHPGLEYLVRSEHREVAVTLSSSVQEITLVSFALTRHSALTEKLNEKIVELYETEQLRENYERWMNTLNPLKHRPAGR